MSGLIFSIHVIMECKGLCFDCHPFSGLHMVEHTDLVELVTRPLKKYNNNCDIIIVLHQ